MGGYALEKSVNAFMILVAELIDRLGCGNREVNQNGEVRLFVHKRKADET